MLTNKTLVVSHAKYTQPSGRKTEEKPGQGQGAFLLWLKAVDGRGMGGQGEVEADLQKENKCVHENISLYMSIG
jgi:hypothetical protein